ncbi:MAG: hypothetical protein IH899_17800 [Planctomycetes bacterium]|nr:hypothetical protein [Planctomycetota bacterium]
MKPSVKIMFVIRFSILSELRVWRLNQTQNWDQYERLLFSVERLEQRFRLFECLTLP